MTKVYVVIHTNKKLNISALKGYIACFNIRLYKRNITLENGIRHSVQYGFTVLP